MDPREYTLLAATISVEFFTTIPPLVVGLQQTRGGIVVNFDVKYLKKPNFSAPAAGWSIITLIFGRFRTFVMFFIFILYLLTNLQWYKRVILFVKQQNTNLSAQNIINQTDNVFFCAAGAKNRKLYVIVRIKTAIKSMKKQAKYWKNTQNFLGLRPRSCNKQGGYKL